MNKRALIPPCRLSHRRYLSLSLLLLAALSGQTACRSHQPPGAGPQQRVKLTVGEIRPIRLPAPADTTATIAGSSDNSEVVDVTLQPETATQTRPMRAAPGGPLVFLLKGVTTGTARVVFSEKRTGDTGPGAVRKVCLVQVVNK